MDENKKIRDLSLFELLEMSIGREKAETILSQIQDAVDKGIKGDELKKLIHKQLCDSSITDMNVYHILLMLPKPPPPVVT